MFRFLLFLFDSLNGNLHRFHNDFFNNFCFKCLSGDIFIFSIVIPVCFGYFVYLFISYYCCLM